MPPRNDVARARAVRGFVTQYMHCLFFYSSLLNSMPERGLYARRDAILCNYVDSVQCCICMLNLTERQKSPPDANPTGLQY